VVRARLHCKNPSPDSPGQRPEGAQTRGPCRALSRRGCFHGKSSIGTQEAQAELARVKGLGGIRLTKGCERSAIGIPVIAQQPSWAAHVWRPEHFRSMGPGSRSLRSLGRGREVFLFQFKMCPRRGDRRLLRSGGLSLASCESAVARKNKQDVRHPTPAADQWRGIGSGPRGPWPASPSPRFPGQATGGSADPGPMPGVDPKLRMPQQLNA